MLQERVRLELGGVELTLLKERAIWIHHRKTLVLSDIHLGKLEHFRKNGLPVPVVNTDLERLTDLVQKLDPREILFLGDLFHSTINSSAERFKAWRNQYGSISMRLVEGNHDILPADAYPDLGLDLADNVEMDGLIFQHHPDEDASSPMVCGHIHPGILLQGAGRQSMKLPCFYRKDHLLLMPAFGSTTGLHVLQPASGSEVFAITPSGLAYYAAKEKI